MGEEFTVLHLRSVEERDITILRCGYVHLHITHVKFCCSFNLETVSYVNFEGPISAVN